MKSKLASKFNRSARKTKSASKLIIELQKKNQSQQASLIELQEKMLPCFSALIGRILFSLETRSPINTTKWSYKETDLPLRCVSFITGYRSRNSACLCKSIRLRNEVWRIFLCLAQN